MLTLLYGTRSARDEIYNRIKKDVDDGRRAYLIVPDQKALLSENSLMEALPKSAALLVDAVGFSRLANLVCRRYGSLTYNYATDGTKVLTMYRAVKELSPLLKVFGGETESATLQSLCSLMNEFRACSVNADELADAAEKIGDTPLADKLHDLALIYSRYEAILHEKFSEETDDIDTLARLLSENDFFGDAHIYIDSFLSFTKQETAVLSTILSHGSDVCIALPFSRRGMHMAECADTRKRILSLCAKLAVKIEEHYIESGEESAISFAKDYLWDFASCDTYDEDTKDALELVCCATKSEETELVMREIFKALEEGYSYSDIAIIARNPESYQGTLDRMLERSEIPFFFSKKTEADILPLTKFILSALSLYVYNFKENDVAAYIKTGLAGLGDDECDIFEEYISRWNICGKARYLNGENFTMSWDGYTAEITDPETLTEVNEVKHKITAPLARLCDTLDGAKTVRDYTTAVYEYLLEMGIREKSCDPEFAKYFGVNKVDEAVRLWNVTLEAFDTMVEAAGDEEATALDFCTLTKLLFSAIDIANIPSSKDQIIIGGADTIRIDERKIVIILGANEGVFPAPVKESPTLGENERNLLKAAGVELSQDLTLRSARELYHFARSIDFATEKAVISYYAADIDGEKAEPSFAVARLNKIFTKLYSYSFSSLASEEKIFYPELASDSVGKYDAKTEAALRAVLSERGMYIPQAGSDAMLSNSDAALSNLLAKEIYGENMRLSQSKIDTYCSCRLQHFMQYIIALEDTAPFEFNPANLGTFVHSIVENFVRTVNDSGKKIRDLTEAETEQLAITLCAAETEKIMRAESSTSARMLCFFERMKKNILLILKNLVNEFKNSDFEPFLLEYKIGLSGGHKPLVINLGDGATATLGGIADRIDIYKNDGKVYLRVADYKSGKKEFKEDDLAKGKNLQLLIYLFALCNVADKQFFDLIGAKSTDEIIPAGATYFVVNPPKILLNSKPSDEDALEKAEGSFKRLGFVFDAETLASAIDKTAAKIFSSKLIKKDDEGVVALFETVKDSVKRVACDMRAGRIDTKDTNIGYKSPCRYCAYKAVCRKEDAKGDGEDNG
ncbi:MAG: PD-(D/E)XK nuclease family protein [Clostridia bacterium]|nr:PD-(D/E)XK nuclease family protein [Clostridia bacterium]